MTVQEALELLKADSVGWIHHPSECSFTRTDVLKVAMECMEKQIPKRPNIEGDGYDPDGNLVYDTWICPNCEKYYEIDYDDYDYCPNCGQAIDKSEWSEEDV